MTPEIRYQDSARCFARWHNLLLGDRSSRFEAIDMIESSRVIDEILVEHASAACVLAEPSSALLSSPKVRSDSVQRIRNYGARLSQIVLVRPGEGLLNVALRGILRGIAAVSVTDIVLVGSFEDAAYNMVATARTLDGHAVSYDEALEALRSVRRALHAGHHPTRFSGSAR